MRKRHFTSNRKLPNLILLLLICSPLFAKETAKETNITCYAAKNKWICAAGTQHQQAKSKAEEISQSEVETSDVVIKSLTIPKFDTVQQNSITTKSISRDIKVSETSKSIDDIEISTQTELLTIENYKNYWSYQLIGVSTENSAIKYVKINQLSDVETSIIKTSRDGMSWWVILYGKYATKSEAITAQNTLPVTQGKPWLRPLNNLNVIEVVLYN